MKFLGTNGEVVLDLYDVAILSLACWTLLSAVAAAFAAAAAPPHIFVCGLPSVWPHQSSLRPVLTVFLVCYFSQLMRPRSLHPLNIIMMLLVFFPLSLLSLSLSLSLSPSFRFVLVQQQQQRQQLRDRSQAAATAADGGRGRPQRSQQKRQHFRHFCAHQRERSHFGQRGHERRLHGCSRQSVFRRRRSQTLRRHLTRGWRGF